MIDKVVLRAEGSRRVTRDFSKLSAAVGGVVWRPNAMYERSGDFSAYGLPAIVFLNCKMGADRKRPTHKIELLETGKKTIGQMFDIVSTVFEGDPNDMDLTRADLTSDVDNVGVQWFREHVYLAYKRTVSEWGYVPPEVPVRSIRSSRAQTIYGGKGTNQIRIYDKVGETHVRYKKYCRRELHIAEKQGVEMILPTFQQWSGYAPGSVVTRVERQTDARHLEKLELVKFGSLRKAEAVRPFGQVRFFADNLEDISRERWGAKDYAFGEMLRRDVLDFGMDRMMEMLRIEFGKNWRRYFTKYQPFIRASVSDYREQGITSAQLQANYEDSTRRQMAA